MPDELVTQGDVEAKLLRPLTATESNYIETNIAAVSSQLRSRVANLDARLAFFDLDPRPTNAIDPALVSSQLAAVIKRYLVNIEGATSKSRGDGPFTSTISFASYGKSLSQGTQGELQVTDDDVAAIVGAAAKRTGPASIRLSPGLAPGGTGCRFR